MKESRTGLTEANQTRRALEVQYILTLNVPIPDKVKKPGQGEKLKFYFHTSKSTRESPEQLLKSKEKLILLIHLSWSSDRCPIATPNSNISASLRNLSAPPF